jgi:hypothetical protein
MPLTSKPRLPGQRRNRAHRSPNTVCFFHANVTDWGPKAEGFLLKQQEDVMMICETHLDENRSAEVACRTLDSRPFQSLLRALEGLRRAPRVAYC